MSPHRIICALLVCASASIGNAATPLPITLAALQPTFAWASSPLAAPDGSALVYTQCTHSKNDPSATAPSFIPTTFVPCEVILASTGARSTRYFGRGTLTPSWSPNGEFLAFFCPVQSEMEVCVWSVRTSRLQHYPKRQFDGNSAIQWLADSTRLVLAEELKPHVGEIPWDSSAEKIETLRVYRSAENVASDPRHGPNDVLDASLRRAVRANTFYVLDIGSGEFRSLGSFVAEDKLFSVAPQGNLVAIVQTAVPDAAHSAQSTSESSQTPTFEVHILNVDSGASVRVISSLEGQHDLSWSPDGSALAWYGKNPGRDAPLQVFLAKVSDGVARAAVMGSTPFALKLRANLPPLWSRDGSHIVTLSEDTQGPLPNAVWSIDVAERTAQVLFSDPDIQVTAIVARRIENSAARSFRPHESTVWSFQNENSIVVTALRLSNLNQAFIALPLEGGLPKILLEEAAMYDSVCGDQRGERMLFLRQRAASPLDVYALSAQPQSHLTRLSDHWRGFTGFALGRSRLLSYSTSGGALHAALLLPPDFRPGLPVPTVVYPYGSAFGSRNLNRFGVGEGNRENLQLLATRGMAVLVPDVPYFGVTPMEDDFAAVMPAVDAAIAQGYSDPDRLGVMGHSHGGYDVYALIVQTNRFKAAVARAGYVDWVSVATSMNPDGYAYSMHSTAASRYGLGTELWNDPQRYLAESPLYQLQNVRAAVLIMQGSADTAVRPFNAEQAFVALRELHKNAALALYPSAEHNEELWPMRYQIDYLNRMVDWFTRYLH